MHSALQVTEIVQMVCRHGSNKDIIHLAITCQDLFHIAIPIAWEKVKGVLQLIKLIRTVVVDEEKFPFGNYTITTIDFSGPPKREYLDRWQIYAPFVRKLEIVEEESTRFHMGTLSALLPKEPQAMNYLFWVKVFGSSSLRDLRATYHSGSLSFLLPQSLDALGRLPNLDRLEIYYPPKSTRQDIDDLRKGTLSPTAFPALKALVLNNLIQHGADFLWDLPPLVSKLTTVELKFNPYPRRQQNEWALREMIPKLCDRSPYISELLLEFDCDSQEGIGMPHMCQFTDTAFGLIAQLSLTRLEVMHARLAGPDVLFKLTRTWPNLEVLRWTAQHIKVQELQEFALFLPKLKHLAVEVNMMPLPEEVDMTYIANLKRREMRTLESGLHKFSDLAGNDAARIYWYLSVMWPNARLETRASHIDSLPGRRLDLFCVNVVNHMEPLVLDMQSVVGVHPDNFSNGIYDDAVQNYVRVMWDAGCKFMRPQLEKINAPWRMLPAEALPP
ncbi:hypothetical protein RHS01_10685 [Rhizoctonia solani]|uniref:Uncharacterized protein n=1 Tax=Rhizoctonia solani TaxID=456999 RepID=A0A8H7I1J8_9AGAM|nr:hypothetical protein RHS01_10685 [Rhizoctonia solani]